MRSIFEIRHTNTAHAPIRRASNLARDVLSTTRKSASRLIWPASFAALRTCIAHGCILVGCGVAVLGAGAAAANPITVELTGEVHTTARSGYAGKIVELGDPDSKDRALWGLYSEETSAFTNDPCWVQVATESVNDNSIKGSATTNQCGSKTAQKNTLASADFADKDFGGPRAFVSGVRVCLNREGDKVKGWDLYGKKINDDGSLSDTNRASFPGRANCPADGSGWQSAVNCPAGELATAAEVHFGPGNDERSWIGIALKCRKLMPVAQHGISATSTTYATQGSPFQAVKPDSGHVLVSVSGSTPGVQVFTDSKGTLKSSCVHAIPSASMAANVRLSPGSADVGVGIGDAGVAFFKTDDLVGCGNPAGIIVNQGPKHGTLDVAFTPDGKFAFVLNEYGAIGVVKIKRDAAGHIATGTQLLGSIAMAGSANAGMALSPDGKRLYVSTEIGNKGLQPAGAGNSILFHADGCVQRLGTNAGTGLLTVIDVAKATHEQTTEAVISTVAAGCSPTRIAVTADGDTIWVAARGDNRVLAFGAKELESNPGQALLGHASTGGDAPVGLGLIQNDKFLVVANSNRFNPQNVSRTNAVILDVSKPAAASIAWTIKAGDFPREVTPGPDDATVYLTNFRRVRFR
jgi:DNA-binding beta-propeller fold protein YncE